MDEAKLAEIDERRARVLRDGTAAGALCMAADDVPALVAEVRRLTAALAAHQDHTDAAVDGVRAMLPAALATARREGAEEMLARCRTAALDAFMAHPLTLDHRHEPGCICHAIARGSCSECDRGDAIMAALAALPLDAPGGAT